MIELKPNTVARFVYRDSSRDGLVVTVQAVSENGGWFSSPEKIHPEVFGYLGGHRIYRIRINECWFVRKKWLPWKQSYWAASFDFLDNEQPLELAQLRAEMAEHLEPVLAQFDQEGGIRHAGSS